MARCGGCDTTWAGLSIAHCSVCHETFTGVTGFDQHRARKYREVAGRRLLIRDHGQCHDPREDGMVRNDRGQWQMPNDGYDWSARRRSADSRALPVTETDETGRVGIQCRDGLS